MSSVRPAPRGPSPGTLHRATLLVALTTLIVGAGCTQTAPPDGGDGGSSEQRLYEHRWTYGPSTYGRDELPVFEDRFAVPGGTQRLGVRMEWSIQAGQAAVVLTPPGGGERVNLTSAEHGGPGGAGEATVDVNATGTWGFEIPTWRGEDDRFPEGHVRVTVDGR